MKSSLPKFRLPERTLQRCMLPALVGLSLGVMGGCAHQGGASESQESYEQLEETNAELRDRLEEVERTNGRLNVRLEELEDQLFLVQDMTESNRLALKRRRNQKSAATGSGRGDGNRAQARAPAPPSESYYDEDDSPYRRDRQQDEGRRESKRNVTRIPLSDQQSGRAGRSEDRQDERSTGDSESSEGQRRGEQSNQGDEQSNQEGEGEDLVISEAEFREFSGESAPRDDSGPVTREQEAAAKAQPPVTDEKLGASDKDQDKEDKKGKGEGDSKSKSDSKKSEVKRALERDDEGKPLDLYKAALSDYREGNYTQALEGFHTFLDRGPNPNYIDNALYWLGECKYGLREYDEAIEYFEKVIEDQPNGNKVPDAMLKMSMAYEKIGEDSRTRGLLEKLAERYPSTNAGRLGKEKLSKLDDDD